MKDSLSKHFPNGSTPSLTQLKAFIAGGEAEWSPTKNSELYEVLLGFDRLFEEILCNSRHLMPSDVHRHMKERAPFFMWLDEDRKAVFAFNNETQMEKERGISFQTQDGRLIDELRKYFDAAWRDSC